MKQFIAPNMLCFIIEAAITAQIPSFNDFYDCDVVMSRYNTFCFLSSPPALTEVTWAERDTLLNAKSPQLNTHTHTHTHTHDARNGRGVLSAVQQEEGLLVYLEKNTLRHVHTHKSYTHTHTFVRMFVCRTKQLNHTTELLPSWTLCLDDETHTSLHQTPFTKLQFLYFMLMEDCELIHNATHTHTHTPKSTQVADLWSFYSCFTTLNICSFVCLFIDLRLDQILFVMNFSQ